MPDTSMPDLFDAGRVAASDDLPALVRTEHELSSRDATSLVDFLDSHTVVVLAGEGTFSAEAVADSTRRDREAQALLLSPSASTRLCWPTRFPTCARTATPPLSADTTALWGR